MKRSPCVHILLLLAFIINTTGPIPAVQAQVLKLPVPGVMVHLSPPMDPPILKGIKVHPDNPFKLEFILDKGDTKILLPTRGHVAEAPIGDRNVSPSPLPSIKALNVKAPQVNHSYDNQETRNESIKLIKYFLASLTIPENDLWVNLSPYEKNKIIPNSFGLTEMGRDLLAEDYMLKQITASLIYPEDEVGKKFWNRVYAKAYKQFGTTNIPVNTFNKVWIVPEKAVVYENAKMGTAYVVESRLKVMLEEDYLSLQKQLPLTPSLTKEGESKMLSPLFYKEGIKGSSNDINALGSQIIREIILPELTREVNQDKNFAQLRQVYNSLILATWYKKKIKDSILARIYADQKKVAGVGYDQSVIPAWPTRGHVPRVAGYVSPSTMPSDAVLNVKAPQGTLPNDVESIYHRYLQAFKKGVFNYIKEEPSFPPLNGESQGGVTIPRKYFSGGMDFAMASGIKGVGAGIRNLLRILKNPKALSKDIEQEESREVIATVDLEPQASEGGVSMNDYIQAQRRLLNQSLSQDELIRVLLHLGILKHESDFKPEHKGNYYDEIIRQLAQKQYDDEVISMIKGQTSVDQRLNVVIENQSGNPKGQGIIEAVSNSIDALGGEIGQFGKGVKQIVDWLEANTNDSIDVYSKKEGFPAHRVHIYKGPTGELLIQVYSLSFQDFQAAGNIEGFTHGTVVRIRKSKAIARLGQVNSLSSMAESIHRRFAFTKNINIFTRINDEDERHVNGWENRQFIVGTRGESSQESKARIYVHFKDHEISIIDNGIGMSAGTISRMFVPGEGGTKSPEALADPQAIAEEVRRVALINDRGPEKIAQGSVVSFARNGEIVMQVALNQDIVADALMPGEMTLELCRLIEVNQARDKIIFPSDHELNQEWPIATGVNALVEGILHSKLDLFDKLRAINTIIAGLDHLIAGNENNAYIVRNIKSKIKTLISPMLEEIQSQGYLLLASFKSIPCIIL